MSDHAFWLYWTVVVVGFLVVFLPVEIYGAIRDPGVDTLSAWVWRLLGTEAVDLVDRGETHRRAVAVRLAGRALRVRCAVEAPSPGP